MKFAHLADCHLGCWRNETLRALGLANFTAAIDRCLAEHVGFVLIAGDLFDVALPSVTVLSHVAAQLERLRVADIACYVIAGSHDYSATGKTMLDVLAQAGLLINVMQFRDGALQFVADDRTGVRLCGIGGRKGGLEVTDYDKIANREDLCSEEGFTIFLFHTLLTELKPDSYAMVPGSSLALLPRGFSYYAGGHPHFVYSKYHEGYGVISYPGPLFPANFKELEELGGGGFYLVSVNDTITCEHVPLRPVEVASYRFDVSGKHPDEVADLVCSTVADFSGKIVTLRFFGTLTCGVAADISFAQIYTHLADAYAILRTTAKVVGPASVEFSSDAEHVADIESAIILDSSSDLSLFADEHAVVAQLLRVLYTEKQEGEKVVDFERRVLSLSKEIFQ